MPTELWAVPSAVLATLLAALAAFLLKRGATQTHFSPRQFSLSPRVAAAIGLYLVSSLLFLVALMGAQLSLLLPLTTLEYIWVALLGKLFLGEKIGPAKALGIVLVIGGVLLVGFGS